MKGLKSAILSESGHTVVEVIIAMALLTVTLVPVSRFMSKIFLSSSARNLITAGNLARAEMEAALNTSAYLPEERFVRIGGRTWRVERKFHEMSGLVSIAVAVYEKGTDEPIVEFSTLRTRD